MTVRVAVSPDLLRWAVERSDLQPSQVERAFPSFKAWVEGSRTPTLKQIQEFARRTHAPFGMLFLDSVPEEKLPIPDMRTVRNEDISRPSANLLDTLYAHQLRQQWYRDYALSNGAPELPWVGSASLETPPADVAMQMRGLLELEDKPTRSGPEGVRRYLVDRLERLGVLVMISGVVGSNSHRKLDPQEFRGFALADSVAPLIFVNGADSKSAQNFTLIHEWAHIWLGGSALSDAQPDDREGRSRPEELWCNKVAAEVLVPTSALLGVPKSALSTTGIRDLALRHGVSSQVVLRVLFDAGILSWEDYQSRVERERAFFESLSAAQVKTADGGNYYKTQALRLGGEFIRAVGVSALEGATSFRDAYALLGTKKHSTFKNLLDSVGVSGVPD